MSRRGPARRRAALFFHRTAAQGVGCGPFPIQIDQGRDIVVIRLQYYDMARIVFMDGRKHLPATAPHTKVGDSIGRWEGDTLVVDTDHLEPSTITNNGAEGVRIVAVNGSQITDGLISNNTISNNGGDGILFGLTDSNATLFSIDNNLGINQNHLPVVVKKRLSAFGVFE